MLNSLGVLEFLGLTEMIILSVLFLAIIGVVFLVLKLAKRER